MITKEQAEKIMGDDGCTFILFRILDDGNVEVASATNGRIHRDTLMPAAEAAAATINDLLKKQGGCQCPKCSAARALSQNAPTAQA